VRKKLRGAVETHLKAEKKPVNGNAGIPGMDEAQMRLCIEYAGQDAALSFEQLLGSEKAGKTAGRDGKLTA
jgi:hypothetical protein